MMSSSSTWWAGERPQLAFLGLGMMGKPIVQRFLMHGYCVTVWNRTTQVADTFKASLNPPLQALVRVADTIESALTHADIVCIMLADPASVNSVFEGDSGLLQALRLCQSRKIVIVDFSTVDAVCSRRCFERVTRLNSKFSLIACPVSGSVGPATDGQLVLMASGDQTTINVLVETGFFGAISKAMHFVGSDVGKAANMKLCVNAVMSTTLVALSEGLSLAEFSGLDPTLLLQILDQGTVACPMFRMKGPNMLKRQFPTAFSLKHAQKDLRLALELSSNDDGECLNLPLTAASNEIYKRSKRSGNGDLDFSAVFDK